MTWIAQHRPWTKSIDYISHIQGSFVTKWSSFSLSAVQLLPNFPVTSRLSSLPFYPWQWTSLLVEVSWIRMIPLFPRNVVFSDVMLTDELDRIWKDVYGFARMRISKNTNTVGGFHPPTARQHIWENSTCCFHACCFTVQIESTLNPFTPKSD